jgi:leader peptidase (prepilin peptidase)/N-methyltransferase
LDLFALYAVYAFIWGAIWGSFLNVVIYRLPRGMSLVRPRSRCPECEKLITWRENIPLVSYWALRRRCRWCKTKISARYFAVELLTAVLSLALMVKCADGRLDVVEPWLVLPTFLFYFYFICAAIAIAFIDFELTVVPDLVAIPSAVMGFLAAVVLPKTGLWADFHPAPSWLDSLIGVAVGAGVVLAIAGVYKLLTGRVGMGGGDATTLAMVGAYLGWQSLIFVFFFASVQGLLFAVGAAGMERIRGEKGTFLRRGVDRPEYWSERDEDGEKLSAEPQDQAFDDEDPAFGKTGVPFGPFIALAAVEYLFIGEWAQRWMMGGGL